MDNHKIGFWSVFAIVTGSQIGSGVFMLPSSLAPFGIYSIIGWFCSAFGAIALAIVFAMLCARLPKTGGPHAYVQAAFGPSMAFFTGWTYWVISWVSTTAVIVACIGYLTPIIGEHGAHFDLMLEIGLLIFITGLNLRGVEAAGHAEIVLTVLKFLPLLFIPIVALFFFDTSNLTLAPSIAQDSTTHILGRVTMLTLWGFVGLECATTPAGEVKNPSKTIPIAIVLGTVSVAVLYLLNSVGVMGLVPGTQLELSKAPYVDATVFMFGGKWYLIMALIGVITCVGTFNAWMLTSGQIALGISEDGLFPKCFSKKNNKNAPVVGLLCSALGILPLLVLTVSQTLAHQITAIIDFSVTAFLFIYLISCIAFLKLHFRQKTSYSLWKWLVGIIGAGFCAWVLFETDIRTIMVSSIFVLSGLPVYFLWYKRSSIESSNN